MPVPEGRSLPVGRKVHLYQATAVFRKHVANRRTARRFAWRARARGSRRQHHDGSHFSAGSIAADSPAGKYLIAHGVKPHDFNSYGARRGNHESDDARHICQHSFEESARARTRRRLDDVPARRRADDDLTTLP